MWCAIYQFLSREHAMCNLENLYLHDGDGKCTRPVELNDLKSLKEHRRECRLVDDNGHVISAVHILDFSADKQEIEMYLARNKRLRVPKRLSLTSIGGHIDDAKDKSKKKPQKPKTKPKETKSSSKTNKEVEKREVVREADADVIAAGLHLKYGKSQNATGMGNDENPKSKRGKDFEEKNNTHDDHSNETDNDSEDEINEGDRDNFLGDENNNSSKDYSYEGMDSEGIQSTIPQNHTDSAEDSDDSESTDPKYDSSDEKDSQFSNLNDSDSDFNDREPGFFVRAPPHVKRNEREISVEDSPTPHKYSRLSSNSTKVPEHFQSELNEGIVPSDCEENKKRESSKEREIAQAPKRRRLKQIIISDDEEIPPPKSNKENVQPFQMNHQPKAPIIRNVQMLRKNAVIMDKTHCTQNSTRHLDNPWNLTEKNSNRDRALEKSDSQDTVSISGVSLGLVSSELDDDETPLNYLINESSSHYDSGTNENVQTDGGEGNPNETGLRQQFQAFEPSKVGFIRKLIEENDGLKKKIVEYREVVEKQKLSLNISVDVMENSMEKSLIKYHRGQIPSQDKCVKTDKCGNITLTEHYTITKTRYTTIMNAKTVQKRTNFIFDDLCPPPVRANYYKKVSKKTLAGNPHAVIIPPEIYNQVEEILNFIQNARPLTKTNEDRNWRDFYSNWIVKKCNSDRNVTKKQPKRAELAQLARQARLSDSTNPVGTEQNENGGNVRKIPKSKKKMLIKRRGLLAKVKKTKTKD